MSTPDERLAFVQTKIARAEKHFDDLKRSVQAFLATQPYVVATKRDSTTRRLIYYLASVQPTPPELASIAGDVIQNLRSALDHLAYQLFLVGPGAQVGDGHRIYFPIDDNALAFKSNLPNRTKGMRPDAISALLVVEPYQGGKGHSLWIFSKLSNTDKHRSLIAVGSAFRSVNIGPQLTGMLQKSSDQASGGGIKIPKLDFFVKPADRMFPLKQGDELFIDMPDAEPNPNIQFRFEVSLSEPKVVEGEPLIETIQMLFDEMRAITPIFRPCLA
jgi:hypothetical protein